MSLNYSWTTMKKDIKLNNGNDLKKFDTDLIVVFPLYQQIK
jgi:hypothetical protein